MLLDEPTNNLDLDARKRLYDAVASWTGVMVIVSHDRELLGLVDQVADLSGGEVRMYGGNLDSLRGASRGRTGGGGTRGHLGRRRRPPGASRLRRRAGQAGPARPAGPEGRGLGQPAQDRRARPQAIRAGDRGPVPRAARRAARRRPVAGWTRPSRRSGTTPRSGSSLPGTAVPAGRTVLTVTGLAGAHWHPASPAPVPPTPVPHPSPQPPADPARVTPAPRRAGGTHRPRPGADRPDRPERRGQDHPAPRRSPAWPRRPGVMSGSAPWSATCRSASISSTTR